MNVALDPENRAVNATHWSTMAVSLLLPLASCVANYPADNAAGLQVAAANVAKPSSPQPKEKEQKRKNRPDSKLPPESDRLPRPPIKLPGSGDALPVATYEVPSSGVMGAVVPGVSVAEGAIAGAAIGGLAGAIWADQNNDGYVDGYVYNGQYYGGTPAGYDNTLGRVATGAAIGAGVGAVAGAAIPGLSVIQGAVIGARVDGLAGAVWADRNNDGQVDGYIYNGQYYPGQPPAEATTPVSQPLHSGERG